MSYHPLTQESGGDAQSRVEEAHRIGKTLEECSEELEPKELSFVAQMADCWTCTVKQLFWLRDIKEKYLD